MFRTDLEIGRYSIFKSHRLSCINELSWITPLLFRCERVHAEFFALHRVCGGSVGFSVRSFIDTVYSHILHRGTKKVLFYTCAHNSKRQK